MKSAVSKTTTRRQFATWLAAATAGAGAGATAVVAVPITAAIAPPDDDSALLKLKERIFEAWHAANADRDEIDRLTEARRAKYDQLLSQEKARHQFISMKERWELVWSMPEFQPLERLIKSSDEHWERMFRLVEDMWAAPARTEAGRSAKVSVVLACVLDWRLPDEEMDWRELMARRLLVDLVGGEEAQSFREIYA